MDIANTKIDLTDVPDIEENEFHPMNDQFNQELRHIQRMVMSHQRTMTPRHVKVVKMRFAGMKTAKIAEQSGYAPATVTQITSRDDCKRLLGLLNYVESAMLGPSASHRTAMLYRIAVRNEEKDPKVTLQAVAEMNKMEMNAHNKSLGSTPTNTTIIINPQHFPKTPLDG
jgi:hypothetical protein